MTSFAASDLPLGALPAGAPFGEALVFQLAGLAVVMVSLGLLWLLVEGVSVFFKRAAGAAGPRAEAGVARAAGGEAAGGGEVSGEITAVIAAAVTATLGRGVVVRGIRPPSGAAVAPPNPQLAAWTLQGRLQHHTSHSLR